MEPQSSRSSTLSSDETRSSLWSQLYKILNAGNEAFFVLYPGEFLNSKCFILFVSRWPCRYLVMEQGGSEGAEDTNRENTEGR